MFWMPSAGDIVERWQAEIEHQVEAGATPVLDLGMGGLTTGSAAALLALQLLAARRNDAARPMLLAGGPNSAWPALLLPPGSPPSAQGVFQPAFLYTGANLAEHAATSAIFQAAVDMPGAGRPKENALVASAFLPNNRPGSLAPWEALPFLDIQNKTNAALQDGEQPADPTQDWLAWAVLLLALFLVILAILL